MSAEEQNKKFKLYLGICKRLQKEAESYVKEVEKQELKIQRMRDDNRDIYGLLSEVKICS